MYGAQALSNLKCLKCFIHPFNAFSMISVLSFITHLPRIFQNKRFTTVCSRISDPFHIVSYNLEWATAFWAYSTICLAIFRLFGNLTEVEIYGTEYHSLRISI